jgi:hypothetical protein
MVTEYGELSLPGSQEVYMAILEGIPVAPYKICLEFLAYGVRPYSSERGNQSLYDYLGECTEKGVIPFSEQAFRYDAERGGFLPLVTDRSERNASIEDLIASADFLLVGGKINAIHISDNRSRGNENTRRAMLVAVREQAEKIFSNDYVFYRGILSFSSSDHFDSLGLTMADNIFLHPERIGYQDRDRIVEWFKGLRVAGDQ